MGRNLKPRQLKSVKGWGGGGGGGLWFGENTIPFDKK